MLYATVRQQIFNDSREKKKAPIGPRDSVAIVSKEDAYKVNRVMLGWWEWCLLFHNLEAWTHSKIVQPCALKTKEAKKK